MTNTDILLYKNIQFMLHNKVSKSEFLSQPDLIKAVKKMLELYFHTDIVVHSKQVLDLLNSELYQLFLENKQILSEKHKTDFPMLSLYEFQNTMKGFTRILNINIKGQSIIIEFMNANNLYKIGFTYLTYSDRYHICEINFKNDDKSNHVYINNIDEQKEIYDMLAIEYLLLYDLATDKIRRYVQDRTDKDVSKLSAGLIHELYNLMINHNKLTIELDKLACEIGIINDNIKSILPNE